DDLAVSFDPRLDLAPELDKPWHEGRLDRQLEASGGDDRVEGATVGHSHVSRSAAGFDSHPIDRNKARDIAKTDGPDPSILDGGHRPQATGRHVDDDVGRWTGHWDQRRVDRPGHQRDRAVPAGG